MPTYKQLTRDQRYQISSLLKADLSYSQIARIVGVHKSTISREVMRSHGRRAYDPEYADDVAYSNKHFAHRHCKIDESLKRLIAHYLNLDFSPEQISAVLFHWHRIELTFQSIYRYLKNDAFNLGDLYKKLRIRGRKKRYPINRRPSLKHTVIPERTSIRERDTIIEQRGRIGDWEADTIHGANHQGALVTLVERYTRFTLIGHVTHRTSAAVTETICRLLKPHRSLVHSITFDNGREFTDHQKIAKQLNTQTYFADPYSSWQRGTNENTNGLIRQYFPKKTSLKHVAKTTLKEVIKRLNHRPRKCLAFNTPTELFLGEKPYWVNEGSVAVNV